MPAKQLVLPQFIPPSLPTRYSAATVRYYAERYHQARQKHDDKVRRIKLKQDQLNAVWFRKNLGFELDWDAAPPWAKFFVVDSYRIGHWFSRKPKHNSMFWYSNKGRTLQFGRIDNHYLEWQRRIWERPVESTQS